MDKNEENSTAIDFGLVGYHARRLYGGAGRAGHCDAAAGTGPAAVAEILSAQTKRNASNANTAKTITTVSTYCMVYL